MDVFEGFFTPWCAKTYLRVVLRTILIALDGELEGFLHLFAVRLPRAEARYFPDLASPAAFQPNDGAALESKVLGVLRQASIDIPLGFLLPRRRYLGRSFIVCEHRNRNGDIRGGIRN